MIEVVSGGIGELLLLFKISRIRQIILHGAWSFGALLSFWRFVSYALVKSFV